MSKPRNVFFELAHAFWYGFLCKTDDVVIFDKANAFIFRFHSMISGHRAQVSIGCTFVAFGFARLPGTKPGCRKTKERFVGAGF